MSGNKDNPDNPQTSSGDLTPIESSKPQPAASEKASLSSTKNEATFVLNEFKKSRFGAKIFLRVVVYVVAFATPLSSY